METVIAVLNFHCGETREINNAKQRTSKLHEIKVVNNNMLLIY